MRTTLIPLFIVMCWSCTQPTKPVSKLANQPSQPAQLAPREHEVAAQPPPASSAAPPTKTASGVTADAGDAAAAASKLLEADKNAPPAAPPREQAPDESAKLATSAQVPNALEIAPQSALARLAVSLHHACFIPQDRRSVWCWGDLQGNGTPPSSDDLPSQATPAPRAVLTNDVYAFAGIATGSMHSCAVASSQQDYVVSCWGSDQFNQLGATTSDDGTIHPALVAPGHVREISAELSRTYVLTSDGKVTSFGSGGPMFHDLRARNIAAGGGHACAVIDDGSVQCWGRNLYGQLGSGSKKAAEDRPTAVEGLPVKMKAVAAGADHTCALGEDQNVYCWGLTYGDDRAHARKTLESSRPHRIRALDEKIAQLALDGGSDASCALTTSRRILCWGKDPYSDTIMGPSKVVALTGWPKDIVELAYGGSNLCALTSDDSVWCAGRNSQGELGRGFIDQETYRQAARVVGLPPLTTDSRDFDKERTAAD